jgi:hypothetical protein
MPHASRPILLAFLVSGVGVNTAPTHGQNNTQWQPVDQTVSDLDLRASSSRRIEQGIGVFGQSGSLYQRPDNGQGLFINGQQATQQYQLRQPGFTAWIDRPDYLVRDPLGEIKLNTSPSQDGQFIDLIPPNTVFDLTLTTPRAFVPYIDPYETDLISPRLDTRIAGWIDYPAEQAVQPSPPPIAHRLPPHLMAQRATRSPGQPATTQTSDTPNSDNSTPHPATQPNTTEDDTLNE